MIPPRWEKLPLRSTAGSRTNPASINHPARAAGPAEAPRSMMRRKRPKLFARLGGMHESALRNDDDASSGRQQSHGAQAFANPLRRIRHPLIRRALGIGKSRYVFWVTVPFPKVAGQQLRRVIEGRDDQYRAPSSWIAANRAGVAASIRRARTSGIAATLRRNSENSSVSIRRVKSCDNFMTCGKRAERVRPSPLPAV